MSEQRQHSERLGQQEPLPRKRVPRANRMPYNVRRSAKRREAFLKSFADCGVIRIASEAAGIGRDVHYYWLEHAPGYREQFEAAEKAFLDSLVAEATRRARDGVDEPVFRGGVEGPVGHVRKYSDVLLMFLIKKHDPSYREHYNVELTGRDRGPIRLAADQLDDDELARIAAADHAATGGLRIAPPTQGALPAS